MAIPLASTIPDNGIHSLDPLPRGRGLRLSGSLSKVSRTQSAIASGSALISVGAYGELCPLTRGVKRWWSRNVEGDVGTSYRRESRLHGNHDLRSDQFRALHHRLALALALTQHYLNRHLPTYSLAPQLPVPSPCRPLVSHVSSALCRFRVAHAHKCTSAQESASKSSLPHICVDQADSYTAQV